jgi:hypothetical protein
MINFPLSPRAKRNGNGYVDTCPAHDDGTPSLSINHTEDGKLLLHCFAGCSFEEILAATGLKGEHLQDGSKYIRAEPPQKSEAERTAYALSIWKQTIPLNGTIAEVYLKSRGLEIYSDDMRFHPKLHFSDDSTQRPAMVCAVRRHGRIVGLHRTFLNADGKKLGKKMLGPCGGGSVYVGGTGSYLAVAEGIENALAVRRMSGDHRANFYASLSATGMRKFALPDDCRDLMIFSDGDKVGMAASYDLGQRASLQGWNASTMIPPLGRDWNDELLSEIGGSL